MGIFIFTIILLITTLIVGFALLIVRDKTDRFLIGFINFSIYMYSGIGIAFYNPSIGIILSYSTFIIVLNAFFVAAFSIKVKETVFDYSKTNTFLGSKQGKRFVTIMTVIIFVSQIIQLISLGVSFKEFITMNIFDIVDIFKKLERVRENNITYTFNLIQVFLTPFLFIKLFDLVNNGKRWFAIILYLLWLYLGALRIGYIGRYEMVIALIFLMFMVFIRNNSITRRKMIIIVSVLLLLAPLMLTYEDIRMGREPRFGFNYVSSLVELIKKETSYPQYYTQIIDTRLVSPQEYFMWFITLSIPKKFIPISTVSINDVFTVFITGIEYGDPYYSIILPSLFGEAVIIYGQLFAWVHALFVGLFLVALIRYFKKFRELSFWTIYLVVFSLSMGRGGSQGMIAFAVNTSVLFILGSIFIRFVSLEKMGINPKQLIEPTIEEPYGNAYDASKEEPSEERESNHEDINSIDSSA